MTDNNKIYLVTSTAEAGTVETLPVRAEMELILNDDLARSDVYFDKRTKVCITSEYSLATVLERLDPARQRAANLLKDKLAFRNMLKEIYPEYSFRHVSTEEIASLEIDRKSVIKPVRGIFGTAVKVISPGTDLVQLGLEMSAVIGKNAKVYPETVLSGGDFIVEDFIEGEEYAVDMFYDSQGEPCIVNIMHHPLPANEAYIHMIYNASERAFDAMYRKSKEFFRELNRLLKVTNFAMHSELRLQNDRICPIEINSMRFGGMGLCNLAWFAFGINPFLCFLYETEPDWDTIWKERKEKIYSFFIAYNGDSVNTEQSRPLPDKLRSRFTKVLKEQLFDYRQQLAFGIYFLEETDENIRELLRLDFNEFFEETKI